MNVKDKNALAAQVAKALKPGGRFALFDMMRGPAAASSEELYYPLPFATNAEEAAVSSPAEYRAAFEAAGLGLIAEDHALFPKKSSTFFFFVSYILDGIFSLNSLVVDYAI